MLKVVICDDMLDQLEIMKSLVLEYKNLHKLNLEVYTFNSPDALLLACENDFFHIYILDVVMPMLSGIEVGTAIRRLDKNALIIYASTEESYALSAYSANPINYLIKPIDKDQFNKTLTYALEKVVVGEEKIFSVKTKAGLRVIKLSNLVYCEYNNHKVNFILADKTTLTSLTIKESFTDYIKPLMEDCRFIKTHSAFLVNMSKVKTFSKNGFVMRSNDIIPISNKKYPEVRNKYMDYMLDKVRC